MLTDEARAVLAAMPGGCLRALTGFARLCDGPVEQVVGPWHVPLDPTAIVAEAARMVAGVVDLRVTFDGTRWVVDAYWLDNPTSDPAQDESTHLSGIRLHPLSLRLFQAAWERTQ